MNHALMVLETASRPNSGHFACFYVLSLSGLSQTAKGISLKQKDVLSAGLSSLSASLRSLISWQSRTITITKCSTLNIA